MIKHTTFVKVRTGVDREVAMRRWTDEIGALQLELPGLARAVHNQVVVTTTNDGAVEGPPGFDGMASMWFFDMESFDAARRSEAWAGVERIAGEIFDADWWGGGVDAEIEERIRRVGMSARRDGVSTPPGTPVKLVGFLRYRSDLTREAANDYWRDTHGRIALGIAEMQHYVQNHTIRSIDGRPRPAFDGFSEAWFADFATYEQAMASPQWHALVADGPELFDMSVFLSGIVDERVLKQYTP
jgi:uncharacterized protein (TIGR02118 family)